MPMMVTLPFTWLRWVFQSSLSCLTSGLPISSSVPAFSTPSGAPTLSPTLPMKVPCDAGSVLEADAQGDLRFSAARGPKAAELMEASLVVPSGSGIAGFCAHEGVSVALSDVQKDPRYYAEISRRVDYETRSVLASPMMTHGRTFGCVQLLNKKTSPVFEPHEVGILSYIAHQAALYLNALS